MPRLKNAKGGSGSSCASRCPAPALPARGPAPSSTLHQVRHHARVARLAVEGVGEDALGLSQVPAPVVDDPEGVPCGDEAGIVQHGLARVPVGVVQPAGREGLGGAVVHVHREDGVLLDHAPLQAGHVGRRQEVDGELLAVVDARAELRGLAPQREVHVPDGEVDVALPAPGLLHEHVLEAHLDAHLAGERRRHDHERQAVAGSRLERLRGVARVGRVVVEPELPLAAQRVDERLLLAPGPGEVADLLRDVAAHRVARLEDARRVHGLRRRGEALVREEPRHPARRRRDRAAGERQRKHRDGNGSDHGGSSTCGIHSAVAGKRVGYRMCTASPPGKAGRGWRLSRASRRASPPMRALFAGLSHSRAP